MIEQERLIARVRELAAADERLVAALMYGSFSQGDGDRHSDVEFYLYFRDELLADVDRRAWLEQVAPTLLCYQNEYGVTTAIFAAFVRGEFHFEPASAIAQVRAWQSTWFASLESAVLWDRGGELGRAARPLVRQRPALDERETARFLAASLLNWTLMGASILGRGDDPRAHGFLGFIQSYVLQAARLLADKTQSWDEPRRQLAGDLPAAFERFRRCTARLDHAELRLAYGATWSWTRELLAALDERFGVDPPSALLGHLDELLRSQ